MEPHGALANEGARRIAGRLIGGLIVAGAAIAVVVTLMQWTTRPQTDDTTVRANFVGITPQVSGHIVELRVRDNQQVREGDLLFVVDPRPYEIALARARAALALTRKEVAGYRRAVGTADAAITRAGAQLNASAADVVRREADPVAADAEIARLQAQRVASEASLQRAQAEHRHAVDYLARLEPLLPQQFVTEDRVDEARTKRISAAMAAEQARTSVLAAELDLEFTRVRAPFTGRVVNLNISPGAFARTGVDVFTLVDTGNWYVMANFRETQLRHIPAGAPVDVYLQSHPGRHFRGTVVGLGWAVLPENGTSVNGLPRVERSLDWIRLAARFPVRIRIDDPDESFRIGASAVATVHGSLTRVSQ